MDNKSQLALEIVDALRSFLSPDCKIALAKDEDGSIRLANESEFRKIKQLLAAFEGKPNVFDSDEPSSPKTEDAPAES